MIIVTGGAGFIGSNIVSALELKSKEIAIVDRLGNEDFKWRNIAKRQLTDIIDPSDCMLFLQDNCSSIEGIIHMGAISSTTERDVDAIVQNNIRFSSALWRFCAENSIRFVYASSAATYGDGKNGFSDCSAPEYLAKLRPFNPYGWSKHLFDRMVQAEIAHRRPAPPRWAGLKFFNVYGPNEYHKGGQRSVAVQLYEQIISSGRVRLFKSDNPDYADGEQLRDFVWVKDCADAAIWFLENIVAPSGLYNIGSGKARSFVDLANIAFRALQVDPNIDFITLPENLIGKYQYYTCADLTKLRQAGYNADMTDLETGVTSFIQNYLSAEDRFC